MVSPHATKESAEVVAAGRAEVLQPVTTIGESDSLTTGLRVSTTWIKLVSVAEQIPSVHSIV